MDFANRGARVDVVEINPSVLPVAQKFFDVDPTRFNLAIDDGRHFLNASKKQYDTVILDVFLGDSSPSHLLTREAFRSVQRVLRPGGTLVINSFGHLEEGRDFFATSLHMTLKDVFKSVRTHTDGRGAIFFVASDRAPLVFVQPPNLEEIHPYVRAAAESIFAGVVETPLENGRVLTDDYNPAEFHDAKNREEIRRRLALAFKEG
jgi:SAM-dependent methyltransferase